MSTKNIKWLIVVVWCVVIGCVERAPSANFSHFRRQFALVELPVSHQISRVFNNSAVSNRIDTAAVQRFINSAYRFQPLHPAYYGYAYGFRLPQADLPYTAVLYLDANASYTGFVLATYSESGKPIAQLPLTTQTPTGIRSEARISADRRIVVRTFRLHQAAQDTLRNSYRIVPNGEIVQE